MKKYSNISDPFPYTKDLWGVLFPNEIITSRKPSPQQNITFNNLSQYLRLTKQIRGGSRGKARPPRHRFGESSFAPKKPYGASSQHQHQKETLRWESSAFNDTFWHSNNLKPIWQVAINGRAYKLKSTTKKDSFLFLARESSSKFIKQDFQVIRF